MEFELIIFDELLMFIMLKFVIFFSRFFNSSLFELLLFRFNLFTNLLLFPLLGVFLVKFGFFFTDLSSVTILSVCTEFSIKLTFTEF